MSAEIVDYLLVFWVVLAIVVYTVGSIYEKQLQDRKKRANKDRRRSTAAADRQQYQSAASTNLDDFWLTGASADGRRRTGSVYQSAGRPSWDSPADNSSCYQQQQQQQQQQAYSLANASAHYGGDPYGTRASSGYVGGYPQLATSHQYQQQQVRGRSGSYQFDPYQQQQHYHHHQQQQQQQQQPQDELTASATIPTASGFNSDCVDWVNGILYLFYTRPEKYGPIISENVYRSLNEKLSNLTSSSNEYSSLLIEFTGINTHDSTRPELTNVRTENESDKSISASCKIYNRRINFSLNIRPAGRAGGDRSRPVHGQQQQQQQQQQPRHASHFGHYDVNDDDRVQGYELILENLEGKLKSMAMLNEKLIVIQFIEKPDTKIMLRPTSTANSQLISEDSLVQLILQTITQVVVDLYFGDDVDFPQYKHHSSTYSSYKHKLNNMIKGSASELKRQIKHDFFGALTSSSSDHKERKVFVKIIRATNINYNQNVTCLMELDTPKQQAASTTKQGSDPYWDEHFLFNVNEKSGELVLELWDSINLAALHAATDGQRQSELSGTASLKRNQQLSKAAASSKTSGKWHKADLTAGAKFLGLARVAIDDLRRNPVQKVNLALQPIGAGTDLSDSVGGELQLELLFMEHSAAAATAPANTAGHTALGPSTAAVSFPNAGPLHKSNSLSSLAYQQGDIVSIDRKLTPSGFVITTTTITKQPVSKAQQQQQQQQQRQEQLLMARSQSPIGSASMATDEHSFDEMAFDGVSSSQMSASGTAGQQPAADRRSLGTGAGSSTGGRLSRSRSRSRSFLRAIRKRFSFSRTRSRSVGESAAPDDGLRSPAPGTDYDAPSRASSELSVDDTGGDLGRAKSVPASRDPSEVPTIVINKGRLSDTASAFTFTQPKSQLVYEVLEPTLHDGSADGPRSSSARYRYYAVPDDAASRRKWRKRGLKLHVFNEHQFIACHLAGSSTCHLCGRVFSRRPGKQGYKCRNCHLLSHKQCHVKVDHNCPYAKRDGLKLEYIDADPPTSLVDELMLAQDAVGGRPASQASSADSTHHQYRQQPPSRHTDEPYRRSSQKSRARPSMRLANKSISVEVDDR
jgi:hypothetical protein